jgi:hypothetical protein
MGSWSLSFAAANVAPLAAPVQPHDAKAWR